jgi:ankyrin repeat protein
MMEYLLDLGMDVNALWRREYPPSRRKGRGTPLHAAVSSQERDRIVVLLERGADARIKDTLERTPMEYAVEKGLERAVGILREYEEIGKAA